MVIEYNLFFFKQKTAYEMRISDWSSDVCSSDLRRRCPQSQLPRRRPDLPTQRLITSMQTFTRFYGFSFAFSVACFGLAAWYGWYATGSLRSEERRVGKEGVSTCRCRLSPSH